MLIAINPYQWLSHLNTPKEQERYRHFKNETLPPHVYETAQQAYRGLSQQKQSILVSGESGAGKTETVKLCTQYLSQYGDSTITDRLLYANPVLEAFGNAATKRNDNSSRFGKYLTLQFDADCYLLGGRCDIYLLEKCRVVGAVPGERNFHILHQIAAADTAADFASPRSEFKCLAGVQQESDRSDYAATLEALHKMGICGEDLQTLQQALWVILYSSNVVFTCDDDGNDSRARVENESITIVANLLGVAPPFLAKALTNKTMHAGKNSEIQVPLTIEQAHEGCHAFAKEVYAQAFHWLVDQINQTTTAPNETRSIGILDIFGFESFEENRFEQLCINYANEVLQSKFAEDVFQSLLTEFREEEIDLGVGYETKRDVLDLLSSGVLCSLSEECIRPQGSDAAFVRKLHQSYGASPRLVPGDSEHTFGVRHFAETVIYDAHGFIETNRDTVSSTLLRLCSVSTNDIVNRAARSQGMQQSNMVKNTVLFKFNKQLVALMKSLNNTRTQYIRCIKPNLCNKPLKVENGVLLRQLRSSGVIAAVTIARSSFPHRMDRSKILKRFRYFGARLNACAPTKVQVMCLLVIAMRDYKGPCDETFSDAVMVGKTRVYFRFDALEYLEHKRNSNIEFFALIIQSQFRGFAIRRDIARHHHAATRIASRVRSFQARKLVKRMPGSAQRIQRWYRSYKDRRQKCANVMAAMEVEVKCTRSPSCTIQDVRHLAAIKLQKIVRRFAQRKKLRSVLKQQDTREVDAGCSNKHCHVMTRLGSPTSVLIESERASETEIAKRRPSRQHEMYRIEKMKLREEILLLQARNKELASEKESFKEESERSKSENERLRAELHSFKMKLPSSSFLQTEEHISISPIEYSFEPISIDTAQEASDVSWFSSIDTRTKTSSRTSSLGVSDDTAKIRRRSNFFKSTTLYTHSAESSPLPTEMSTVEKKYNALKKDYQRQLDRNRRLTETNGSMQSVLFELNEGMGQLSKMNRDLREVIHHYRTIFAGESNDRHVKRLVSVPVKIEHAERSVNSATSVSDSTLASQSSPLFSTKAHFTFEPSVSKAIFGVKR